MLDSATTTAPETHLDRATWAKVNRLLVRKMLAEFSHERIIAPHLKREVDGVGQYVLDVAATGISYRFRGRRLMLDHWSIDTGSIEKHVNYAPHPLDALAFVIEFQDVLGITDGMMPIYLDEISATLYGSAFKHTTGQRHVADLIDADYQAVEAAMMEGHPTFVANNGRIGFDAEDYRAYAPEAGAGVRVVWLAVSRERATFSAISGLDHDRLIAEELGGLHEDFRAQLENVGLDPADYLFMPVHPWQWTNRIALGFAAEIAQRHIVFLGESEDVYQAQQSIRTFFNRSDPAKHYVKTAISVLNMGFMRGLSPNYMLATPAINEWLGNLVARDTYLAARGFSIIREIAAVGYRNPYYDTALKADTPYKKMLSALWRESPLARLAPGRRLATMACLLHVDPDGAALTPALIAASGLGAEAWIARYLDAYLAPLVHCFYAYDLAFMPHGENLILVLEANAPVGVVMKDIGEEIGILNGAIDLPPEIRRIAFEVDDCRKLNCLFTDVFDCFFRYLAALLDERGTLPEARFWALVADCIHGYQDAHPERAQKYRHYDVFAETFNLNCLNRLQLANNQQMLNLLDPEKSLQYVGTLDNPLAAHARHAQRIAAA